MGVKLSGYSKRYIERDNIVDGVDNRALPAIDETRVMEEDNVGLVCGLLNRQFQT